MKKLIYIFLLITSCQLPIASFAFAASLSDLNTKGFKDQTTPSAKTTENPFLKQGVSSKDILADDIYLSGIIYNPRDAYALISGFIVKEGDDIAGFKVKVIERDHVILRQMDIVKVLKLE